MAKATPTDRKYTKSHEWIKLDGIVATVGISDHAQEALGDITFIDLPAPGKKVAKAESCATVESVKAASDIYSPVSGEIAEVNKAVESTPESMNEDPYGSAWLFKIKNIPTADLNDLMDAAAYDAFVESEA